MSCPFYTWRSDYYCTKQQNYVDEEIYYKYCRNYDYGDCAIYRGEKDETGGCFLTSACIEAMGLPDDCEELTVLRKFRDTWLMKQPGGQEAIAEYYRVAPGIVNRIRERNDRQKAFQGIYNCLVQPCVALIKGGRLKEAWDLYQKEVENFLGKW